MYTSGMPRQSTQKCMHMLSGCVRSKTSTTMALPLLNYIFILVYAGEFFAAKPPPFNSHIQMKFHPSKTEVEPVDEAVFV